MEGKGREGKGREGKGKWYTSVVTSTTQPIQPRFKMEYPMEGEEAMDDPVLDYMDHPWGI